MNSKVLHQKNKKNEDRTVRSRLGLQTGFHYLVDVYNMNEHRIFAWSNQQNKMELIYETTDKRKKYLPHGLYHKSYYHSTYSLSRSLVAKWIKTVLSRWMLAFQILPRDRWSFFFFYFWFWFWFECLSFFAETRGIAHVPSSLFLLKVTVEG